MALRPALLRRTGGDDGVALLTTVLTMALLAAFSLVVLQQTVSNTAAARKDQDWVAALGAAQAGVDDYVSRLNQSSGYHVHSTATPDPANPAMGTTASGAPRWAALPPTAAATASGARPQGSYHYDVDTTGFTGTATTAANGNLVVTSTGRVGARSRTVKATVRRAGFIDYVYFTDYETPDPALSTLPTGCLNYFDARPTGSPDPCGSPLFDNEKLSGPVHSNDAMLICSAVTFTDTVTTMAAASATTAGNNYRTAPCANGTAATTFQRGGPRTVGKVNLPATNLALKSETGLAASPRGCLFVGPTSITVKGGQLWVKSPWTRTPTPGCPTESWFSVPVNGVLYVDAVPADGTTNDNSWPANDPLKPACSETGIGNPLGYPITGEARWNYPCRAGDVFIAQEGGLPANGLNGRLTVSANNNLYVTNHLDYAPGSVNSFLGLIAEQFLYVWHPTDAANNNLPLPGQSTPFLDARISAALLSVNHVVAVQRHNLGSSLGTLHITGAITQKYRGSVRSVDRNLTTGVDTPHGYAKNYVYDRRLAYDSPPKFLNPTTSSFGVIRTAEAKPAYR